MAPWAVPAMSIAWPLAPTDQAHFTSPDFGGPRRSPQPRSCRHPAMAGSEGVVSCLLPQDRDDKQAVMAQHVCG